MKRAALYLDILFWSLCGSCLFVVGCETFQRIGEALAAPTSTTGAPAGLDIASGLAGGLINPLNWSAWAQLAGGIGTVVAAVWGGPKAVEVAKKVLKK